MASTDLVPVRSNEIARTAADDFMPVLTVDQAVTRKAMVNEFIVKVFSEDKDYGAIPGGNQKPVLLKPGAEKLCSIFGLAPHYVAEQVTEDWTGSDHDGEAFFYYRYTCQLVKGARMMGEAVGSANSWESKYRYRESKRVCPKCAAQAIIAGKEEYGGGWLCWKKQGGCGAKFDTADKSIVDQPAGRVPNPDVADVVNTIQKMAQKRALVAAVLVVTNCSDAFTQDLDDIDTGGAARNTQAAADNVARRKIEDATPIELRPYMAAIDAKGDGSLAVAFKFVQDELIKVAFKEGETIFIAQTTTLRERHPKGTPIPIGEAKGVLLVLWGEVERLRKAKAQREKDEADSAFAVSQ